MSTSDNCKDGASKSNDDVCEVSNNLHNMSLNNTDVVVSVCANCGKEGAKNICNKCNQVKYCNAVCKKKNRHKHKKECEEHCRLAAEHAAELHEKELFKQPPPKEDCPICFQQLPTLWTGRRYQSCCGKMICCGCAYAPVYDNQGNKVDNQKCPFCRVPTPTSDEEAMERVTRRVELNDPIAIYSKGVYYRDGANGYPQDYKKALQNWHRATELGCVEAYRSIGCAYDLGQGVEVDTKRAKHYYELAAIGGDVQARYNIGISEYKTGNMDRALKHFMIAAGCGYTCSVKKGIKQLYLEGHATKDDYTKALRLYQEYLGEIKSPQRDKAAAANEEYCYY